MMASAPGTFEWVGLATSDPPAATEFYCELLGWEARPVAASSLGSFTMLLAGEREVALVYQQTAQARATRVAPHWTPFIAVEDAERASGLAAGLGGGRVRASFDAGDRGRIATLRDATGAIVALWQPSSPWLTDPAVRPWWNELLASELGAAMSFYAGLLGWEYERRNDDEILVLLHGDPIATMRAARLDPAGVPPGWLTHFKVPAAGDRIGRARHLGGRLLNKGWPGCVPIRDPQGAVFGIVEGEPVGAARDT